jgi:hypothetical protein
MMADPILDELNLTTLPEINDAAIEDNFFLGSVLQAHLRSKCLVPFRGGAFTRNTFLYAPLPNGGAYKKGIGSFTLTKQQSLSGTLFDPRFYCIPIIEYLEDIDVLNVGDLAIFSLLETDVANAFQTISAIMALDLQQNGQATARTANMNGWVEAFNDGLVPSWDGNIYTTYGTQARNGAVGKALNGNVYWAGNSAGAVGPITYPVLNAAYNLCRRGKEEPELIVGNKPVISYIENKMQAQQRFGQDTASIRDPYYGATGFRFKNAIVMMDDYMPSAQGYPYSDATNKGLGNNLTSTITYVAPTSAPNNFPAGNCTLTVGEVLLIMNTSRLKFRISDSREFGFNPTDFIRTPDTTRVVSQLKAAVNFECTAPWTSCQMYGIGS